MYFIWELSSVQFEVYFCPTLAMFCIWPHDSSQYETGLVGVKWLQIQFLQTFGLLQSSWWCAVQARRLSVRVDSSVTSCSKSIVDRMAAQSGLPSPSCFIRFEHLILDCASANLKARTNFGLIVTALQVMISLLYFCGMTGFVKERLFQHYFSLVSLQHLVIPYVVQ